MQKQMPTGLVVAARWIGYFLSVVVFAAAALEAWQPGSVRAYIDVTRGLWWVMWIVGVLMVVVGDSQDGEFAVETRHAPSKDSGQALSLRIVAILLVITLGLFAVRELQPAFGSWAWGLGVVLMVVFGGLWRQSVMLQDDV